MASEYLKWKYRNEKPRETRELTPKEKRANWWAYHKWHVVLGAVLLFIAGDILLDVLGVGKVTPDYRIAYVGTAILPDDTAAALENALAALGQDCDGDGKTTVQLNQYVFGNEDSGEYAYAASTLLMADLEDCESCIFLLEDPEGFQRDYQILRRLDGSLPDESDRDYENCYLFWADCPVLTGLDLGTYTQTVLGEEVTGQSQELMAGLCIARRGFWTDKTAAFPEACDSFWELLTEGAIA